MVSDLIIGYSSKKPVIPIVKAARKDGNLYGVMIAIIDTSKLKERLPNPSIIKESRFGIDDKNGNRVYQSDILDNTFDNMQMSKGSPIWLALKGEVVKIM